MATDVELLTVTGDILEALLPGEWQAVQNFQPTGQARHLTPTAYFTKLGGDTPNGSPTREDVWNPARQDFDHGHLQRFTSTIRVQGFAMRDDPDAELTSADVAARASMALQSDFAREKLRAIGAAPLRIQQLPAVAVQDERDAWEEVATFDFLISHSRLMLLATPAASLGPVTIHSV